MSSRQVIEFRIVLPLPVDRYSIAQRYMVSKSTREIRGPPGEGLEIVTQEPFEGEDGSGIFTHKIYHFRSKVPGAIRWAVPDSYLHIHEKAWNAYPHYKTVYSIPGHEKEFGITLTSMHYVYQADQEIPANACGLDAEGLKKRKIVWIDVASDEPAPDPPDCSLKTWTCPERGIRRPLAFAKKVDAKKPPGWIRGFSGTMMIAVKVVDFKFKWFGLTRIVHNWALGKFYPRLFANSHRQLLHQMMEWGPMTVEQLEAYEAETAEIQRRYFAEHDPNVVVDAGAAADDEPIEGGDEGDVED